MKSRKGKDCYWAQEIADKFGISKKTLYEWEEKGKIPKAQETGGVGECITKSILNR